MMASELRKRQETERRGSLAQLVELDATRRCMGHSNIDAVYGLTDAIEGLTRLRDRRATAALDEGESYAEVARGAQISREGARKRYGHLEVVS